MPTLKDTYPLYLNNKAQQPNTDLAVTDKYSGEVAFRTALATPEIIDAAIAGAVRATEPMARLDLGGCASGAWLWFAEQPSLVQPVRLWSLARSGHGN